MPAQFVPYQVHSPLIRERNTTVCRSYYYAGSQRVAMRQGSTFYYLLSDQLGSTTITTNASGGFVAELRYKAWGEVRYSNGITPTLRRFTGEPLETITGLYWVGSRYYDPALGRWNQPDSIIPYPGNVQAWDRFAYVYNSPLKYTDPSGHRTCTQSQAETGDETCDQNIPNTADELIQAGIAGTGIGWEQLSKSDQAIFRSQGWTPENYSIEFITGNAIDISGTYEDPAVWLVGLIGAGRLTPSVVSPLKEFFKPEEVTGTYVVYRLLENGVTRYIGITNDIFRRTEEHFISRGWLIEPIGGLENLNRFDARDVEQALIEYYGLSNLYNQVNSISPNNPIYQQAILRGTEILRSLGFFGP